VSQLSLRPEAAAELEEAHDWYESQQPGFGEEFLLFPYALFFRILEDDIRVIACFHGNRDPRGWQARG